MHTVARMQSTFDLIKSFDIKLDRKQFLSSKTERYELQKRHVQLLNQLKHFIYGLENTAVDGVFNAITKSNDVQVNAEEITEAYENFKKYVICISGQINRAIDFLQDKNTESDDSVNCILQKINSKVKLCIHQGIKEISEVLLSAGRSNLLLEHFRDTMFNLKILEEIEFNKNFSIMSELCRLRERKDLLIEQFRYFILRIGCQKTRHIPIIKKELKYFNKEIQILLSDYHKFRFKLQYFNVQEEKNLQNMLEDIRTMIMIDMQNINKKEVEFVTKRKINVAEFAESEADQKWTRDNLEEISKSVDETMEFLHSLDETVISRKFSAMRYLCELHCLKEQVVSSFENLLYSTFKLNIEDNDEALIERLNQLNSATSNLIGKYETVGTQLILFSEIMEIIHEEISETASYSKQKNVSKVPEMNISDLFGTTDSLRKLHYKLDKEVKYKWFPAREALFSMLKDKEKMITSFLNFLERMPELYIDNIMEVIHSLRQLIINAENVLRRYQSLRLQLIWIAGDCIFNLVNM